MTYGYIRVSSDKQTVENQRFEINNFCERQKLKIDGWIEETISGTKNYNKRELGKLLKRVQKEIYSAAKIRQKERTASPQKKPRAERKWRWAKTRWPPATGVG